MRMARQPRRAYAIRIARMPVAWCSTLVALTAAVTVDPGVGAALVAAICAATWTASGRAALQRRIDRACIAEAVRRRRDARETRLEEAGAPRGGLAAVTEHAQTIIATDETCIAELEELLDTYAEVTISACRLRQSIAALVISPVSDADCSLHGAVVRRRTAQVERWRERCEALEQLLDAIAARIRTHAERASQSHR